MSENENKKENRTRSFRIDDDIVEKINGISKELGITQNDTFEILIRAYELQQDATLVPGLSKDIATFISHTQAIQEAFHNIVNINNQTEERIRQEFRIRLENTDKQIATLLNEKEEMSVKNKALEGAMADNQKELNEKEKELTDARIRISERDKSIDDKQTIIDSLTARLPEQAVIDAKISEQEKEISSLKVALTDAENAKVNAEAKADKALADIEFIKKQVSQDMAIVKKNHANELDTIIKQAAADQKSAVVEARQEERDRAAEKIDKLLSKLEDAQNTVNDLKEEIAEMKSKN